MDLWASSVRRMAARPQSTSGEKYSGYKKVEITGKEDGLYNDQTLDIEEATMEDDSFAGRILLE